MRELPLAERVQIKEDDMSTNELAAKGIILLGVISVVMGGVLAGMGKADPVVTIFVVIGSNALSALAGYITGQAKKLDPVMPDPNDQAGQ